ncbi:MAG: NYN domain-containing protein, partial [Chloroflexota bacterium]
FYYGCLKFYTWKWLDLAAFCRLRLPNSQISKIKYFTARIQPRTDPRQATRQQAYLRAIATLPEVEIYFGHFLASPKTLPLAKSVPGHPGFVCGPVKYAEVMNTEEKGSDVNLATHLVMDGFQNSYDMAIVISNDSDLAYPISVVRRTLKRQIGVITPLLTPDTRPVPANFRPRVASRELSRAASFFWTVDPAHLAEAQFPTTLRDVTGIIRKPAEW